MRTITPSLEKMPPHKRLSWFVAVVLFITGLPLIKSFAVFILEKFYELFLQHNFQK
ncbi:MAG: hypothetical protein J0H55_05275 [Chitinophagaceae bacterium]|nr:hypothetical protein [Chitinophagaceae bacterium]